MKKQIVRVINLAAVAAGVVFVAAMIYGFVTWPAAPIRQDGESFRDKRGTLYTPQEYRRFLAWETALLISGASCFALAFAGQILVRKKRGRG